MKTSQNGINFITKEEGLKLETYLDVAGLLTIGVGHLVNPDDNLVLGDKITYDEAMDFLKSDLLDVERCIANFIACDINQNQYDALASFIFNCGISAFKTSTLLKKLNMNDFTGAVKEFPKWSKITVKGIKQVHPSLLARRNREAELFNKELS